MAKLPCKKFLKKRLPMAGGIAIVLLLVIVSAVKHNNVLLTQRINLTAALLDSYKENFSREELLYLSNHTKMKAFYYNQLLNKEHLEKGMVVNKIADGEVQDECDSLLFSSLRFYSLTQLGFIEDANVAWQAILESRNNGKWLRHPDCEHPTSRDMMIGLLIALSQKPEGYNEIAKDLALQLENNNDYFGNGPIYVSRVTPGLKAYLREFVLKENIFSESSLPKTLKQGFSTNEFTSPIIERGYQAHLIALTTFLELNVLNSLTTNNSPQVASLLKHLKHRGLFAKSLLEQRLTWVTKNLTRNDPRNLFYKWLWLESIGQLNDYTRVAMLKELNSLPFPEDRLPMDCDRKADYLWQRNSDEYLPDSHFCYKHFSGVDYLWMAALLTVP